MAEDTDESCEHITCYITENRLNLYQKLRLFPKRNVIPGGMRNAKLSSKRTPEFLIIIKIILLWKTSRSAKKHTHELLELFEKANEIHGVN